MEEVGLPDGVLLSERPFRQGRFCFLRLSVGQRVIVLNPMFGSPRVQDFFLRHF